VHADIQANRCHLPLPSWTTNRILLKGKGIGDSESAALAHRLRRGLQRLWRANQDYPITLDKLLPDCRCRRDRGAAISARTPLIILASFVSARSVMVGIERRA